MTRGQSIIPYPNMICQLLTCATVKLACRPWWFPQSEPSSLSTSGPTPWGLLTARHMPSTPRPTACVLRHQWQLILLERLRRSDPR